MIKGFCGSSSVVERLLPKQNVASSSLVSRLFCLKYFYIGKEYKCMSTGKPVKKPLSSEAARILEQYRNAGKGIPAGSEGSGTDAGGTPVKPAGPPPAQPMRRSGTRGK